VGAIFLDGGFEAARQTVRRLYEPLLSGLDPRALGKDPKTLLQEFLQARQIGLPQYSVLATRGAAHKQSFEVECLIPQLSVRTTGSGSSRRTAEQEAAMRAFEQIRG
jgi:ribonuclease-3